MGYGWIPGVILVTAGIISIPIWARRRKPPPGAKPRNYTERAAMATHDALAGNHVEHRNDPEHPEDKDWADSEPDPNAP